MTSARFQRRIEQLLDEADAAIARFDWVTVRNCADAVLRLDPANGDAKALLAAAGRDSGIAETLQTQSDAPQSTRISTPAAGVTQTTSFANGRYVVSRFLGEGGKKKVYLAHDSLLDRDVAFALIKTEGLDNEGRMRIQREAQAMGRLGNHPNIVTVFDIGDEGGQPYLVLPILSGGDVEGVIEQAPEHKLPLEQAIRIAIETCHGLELAHSKGIIHRDLKPGNVWLTEDGRAMIGDFGLAVSTDRSRLTQAGMMVGTVSYMPPEQAMGGEVGPRSDLYSLGAMLYEMVCGRPPFVGDESVAIIGQHLNTPPVAPTWHRPDCPPALETLILRLLEKDPSKRPASATEVRQALESVNLGTASAPRDPSIASETPPGGENPLYRRTFVGRENEVKQLQAAFDAALSGQGGLVMVVGEPGIGKTALCEQLATYVALRGGKALVGHCYEEGSLSLPYLAFVEAMRSYVLAREPDGLRSDLGTGAADVARIVSEVRDRVQGVELRPGGDPEDDRWRLLQSVTSFLRNASSVQPLVIVLEDLHWADRGTLDLLLHVSRNLSGVRLLIMGTYRDVEVDRSHPLSGVLADLRRGANFTRVPLRGLTVDEVHRMYEALRGQATPWAQAEAVHRQTEGNPLFVQEVLRYLVEEGLVVREGGRYVPQVDPGVGIPEGLRDVVGKRLNHLSEGCNRLLSVAAVIGRDFDLQTLRGVSNLSEDELYAVIEEAVKVGVLEERSMPGAVRYRFAHAFFRQSLYEEMIAPRRLRLHQEVARALETQYASRREEHAAELAEHFGQSTDRTDLAKAVEYSEMAAKRAMLVNAYGDAARHLELALNVQDVLDPDALAKRCDLLLALGAAIMPAGEPERAYVEVASAALLIAEQLQDRQRCSRCCWLALEALNRHLAGSGWGTPPYIAWAERADSYCIDGTVERVWADIAKADNLVRSGRRETAWPLYRKALSEARQLDHAVGTFFAGSRLALNLYAPRDRQEQAQLASEFAALAPQGAGRSLGTVIWISAFTRLNEGDRQQAEAMGRQLESLAKQTEDPPVITRAMHFQLNLLIVDGRLDEAVAAGVALEERANALGTSWAGPAMRAMIHLGATAPMEERLKHPRDWMQQMLLETYLGKGEEALATARAYISRNSALCDAGDLRIHEYTAILEAACREDSTDLIERVKPFLAGCEDSLASGTNSYITAIGRHTGKAYATLGEFTKAHDDFLSALAICEKLRFRPEIALIRLDLAELLLEHYPDERDAAIEHLDFAIGELRDMKMQPALERALRHRGLLKA